MLATGSSIGSIRVWEVATWKLLREIYDKSENNIEEFHHLLWSDDNTKIVAAGRHKLRNKWSIDDDDNAIAPCPIKVSFAFVFCVVALCADRRRFSTV